MRHLVIALALALIVAGPALAGQRNHGAAMEDMFKRIDQDGNGAITQAEIDGFRESRFAEADGNGDGRITLDEAVAHERTKVEERAERWIAHQDDNGDGAITKDEMGHERGRWLMKADADGDGAVTLDELRTARKKHMGGGNEG